MIEWQVATLLIVDICTTKGVSKEMSTFCNHRTKGKSKRRITPNAKSGIPLWPELQPISCILIASVITTTLMRPSLVGYR